MGEAMSDGFKPEPLTEAEITRRLAENPDLLERFKKDDNSALAELFEVGTGAAVRSVEIRELA
jgi:hypothetical protein